MAHIDCICPPKADGEPRHPDGDTVELRERLDFFSARAISQAVAAARLDGEDDAYLAAILSEQGILYGVKSWTVVAPDDRGKVRPVEVSRPAIRRYLLANVLASAVVGDEADKLYVDVIVPLVALALGSSLPTPTTPSISPTSTASSTQSSRSTTPTATSSDHEIKNGVSRTRRPKPSRPSSTTTSQTGGIVTITPLPDGVSSFSPSLDRAG